MADNFLEKRQEAYRIQNSGKVQRRAFVDVQRLMLKCAESVQYDTSYVVRDDQLSGLVATASLVRHSDSFSISILRSDEADNFLCGSACGLQTAACVILKSNADCSPVAFVRLGMILQAMMLRAAEMGLHAEIVECVNADGSASAVLAVGRPDCR